MARLRQVYLPRWMPWFMLLVLLPVLAVVEYEAFLGSEPNTVTGLLIGFMLAAIIAMLFLVGYRKLPYLYIEG